jgi:hypothetical protein
LTKLQRLLISNPFLRWMMRPYARARHYAILHHTPHPLHQIHSFLMAAVLLQDVG